jgi:hypothetical protein
MNTVIAPKTGLGMLTGPLGRVSAAPTASRAR